MLDDNGTDWAQVGWIEFAGNVRDTFVQFNDPGTSYWTDLFSSYAINSTIQYEVGYNPSCPKATCFSWYANGTWLSGSKYNWTPDDAQSFAEIHDQASQMPGGYYAPAGASNLHVDYPAGSSGSWNLMYGNNKTVGPGVSHSPGPSWDNVSDYGTYGNSSYLTWDSACPY